MFAIYAAFKRLAAAVNGLAEMFEAAQERARPALALDLTDEALIEHAPEGEEPKRRAKGK